MRRIKAVAAVLAAMTLTFTVGVTAMAQEAGYTGWSIEGGAPVFYQAGSKVTNVWVKYGDVCYYVGADGYIVNNRVLSMTGVAEANVTYIDGNQTKVQYEQAVQAPVVAAAPAVTAPVTDISAVNDDFEAFKLLHPEYVAQYANNPAGLMGLYKATYNGGSGQYYLDSIKRYEYGLYNTHHYTFNFSSNGDGTHNAYCACGEYIVETCDRSGHSAKDKEDECSRCGQHFR